MEISHVTGSLLDEFTRAVSKVDKDSMGQIMIDDYFVKTEMNEGENDHMDVSCTSNFDLVLNLDYL